MNAKRVQPLALAMAMGIISSTTAAASEMEVIEARLRSTMEVTEVKRERKTSLMT